jgi:deazaflavin-dependent oxidoreductase (nitroreductase family)
MAYLKPTAFTAKVFNPVAMRFGMSGSATLEVQGRRSGEIQRVPVIPIDVGGSRYVVSTRGESEWVRNVRAAGTVRLIRKGSVQTLKATEIPVEERAPIVDAYRAKAGGMVSSYWKQLPDPADHPVFRLEAAA